MINLGKKILTITSLIAFLGIVVDLLLFIELSKLSKQKVDVATELSAINRQKASLDTLAANLQSKKQEIEAVEQVLPLTLSDYVLFINDLTAVATQSSVVIKFASNGDPEIAKKDKYTYRIQGVTLELSGAYPDILAFMEKVQSLPYYTKLEGISIVKNPEKPGVLVNSKLILYLR